MSQLDDHEKATYDVIVIERPQLADISVDSFIQATCMIAGVPYPVLLSQTRNPEVVRVRHLLCYTLKTEFDLSCTEIGSKFKTDHTFAGYGISTSINKLSLGVREWVDLYEKMIELITFKKQQYES